MPNETFYFESIPSGITEILESIQKFRTYSPYSLSMLVENYIWAANIDRLNDPFEGMVKYRDDQSFEEICYGNDYRFQGGGYAAVLDLYTEYCFDPVRFFEKYRQMHISNYESRTAPAKREGYFSALSKFKNYECIPPQFQEDALKYGALKNEGFQRRIIRRQHEEISMWTHYGDELKGFRITYDPHKIFSIKRISAKFIKYQDTPELIDATKEHGDGMRDPSRPRRDVVFRHDLFGVKGSAWAYEREIRIRTDEPRRIYVPDDSITAITFGEKMPDDQRNIIKTLTLLKNPNAVFYVAKRSVNAYKIEDILLP